MNNFSRISFFAGIFWVASTVAQASPTDLVVYHEAQSTIAFTAHIDKNGTQQIAALDCPVNVPITSLSQCTNQRDLIAVKDFPQLVKKVVLDWAQDQENEPLAPFSASEISTFVQGSLNKKNNVLDTLRHSLADVTVKLNQMQQMQKMMPTSTIYQSQAADFQAQVSALQLKLDDTSNVVQASDQVEAAIEAAAGAVAELILKNDPKTTQPNFIATSLMQNTLALQVVQALESYAGSSAIFQWSPINVSIRANHLFIKMGQLPEKDWGDEFSDTPLVAASPDFFLVFALYGDSKAMIMLCKSVNDCVSVIDSEGPTILSPRSVKVVGRSFIIRAIDAVHGELIQTEIKMDTPNYAPLNWSTVSP
jgi:hypothetical protein